MLKNSPALKRPQILSCSWSPHTQYLISASPASTAASAPHETASKSQLNNWQLLKVAEGAPWQRRLSAKLNVFIPRVMRRSAGELSHPLQSADSSRAAEQSREIFFFLLFSSSCCGSVHAQWTADDASQLANSLISSSDSPYPLPSPSPPISPAKCGAALLAVLSSHHLNSY